MFRLLLAAALPCAGVVALRAAADEPVKEPVGIVEGESISVQGPMSVSVIDGKVKTVLRSGGELRVKSGRATIDLVEGGKIAVCGPAHLSVLKSAGALTVALDSGTIICKGFFSGGGRFSLQVSIQAVFVGNFEIQEPLFELRIVIPKVEKTQSGDHSYAFLNFAAKSRKGRIGLTSIDII